MPTELESVFVSAVKLFSYVATDFLFAIFATLNFSDNQLSQRDLRRLLKEPGMGLSYIVIPVVSLVFLLVYHLY